MILENRVALVTGSTGGGMGRSTALTLAKNGANLILNYGTNRRGADADAEARRVKESIEGLGRRVLLVEADTAQPEAVEAMVRQAVDTFGKIDILVNNAGGLWNPADTAEISLSSFQSVVQAEINAAFYCVRACLPHMRRNRWGRIINMGAYDAGSWAAEHGEPLDYALGKGGRYILTKHLAQKERKHNITVNLINPGPGHTPAFDTLEEALAYADHEDSWAQRQHCTPQDIADAVLYLCSEQARFVTGAHLNFAIQ